MRSLSRDCGVRDAHALRSRRQGSPARRAGARRPLRIGRRGRGGDPAGRDVWFTPDPQRPPTRRDLGLLYRLTETACLLEPFHATPDEGETAACVRKILDFRHVLSLRDPPVPLPVMWILSAGRPSLAIEGFGFQPGESWPSGVYRAARLLFVGLVVVSELPRTRETLLLRLFGAGRVFREAVVELAALPPGARRACPRAPGAATLPTGHRAGAREADERRRGVCDEHRGHRGGLGARKRGEGLREGRQEGHRRRASRKGIEKGLAKGPGHRLPRPVRTELLRTSSVPSRPPTTTKRWKVVRARVDGARRSRSPPPCGSVAGSGPADQPRRRQPGAERLPVALPGSGRNRCGATGL